MANEYEMDWSTLLARLDAAVEVGGFRQWLEEGRGSDVLPMKEALDTSDGFVPKTVRVIGKVMDAMIMQKVHLSEALQHHTVSCDVCLGRAVLDDDVSACPACDGQGVVWRGPLMKARGWLEAMSTAYLAIPTAQRHREHIEWADGLYGVKTKKENE